MARRCVLLALVTACAPAPAPQPVAAPVIEIAAREEPQGVAMEAAPPEPACAYRAEGPPADARTETLVAAHLLVAYRGAKRASPKITRTREEAERFAAELRAQLCGGEEFASMVGSFSDEPGAGERGGQLGRFRRGMMVKPFEEAAFGLAVGELSEVVETDFGFHLILRTE